MARKFILRGTLLLLFLPALILWVGYVKQQKLASIYDQEWEVRTPSSIKDFGAVEHLEIIPLVNFKAISRNLRTEPGVSYLVRAGTQSILFDVGFNQNEETPSPLEYNMSKLGISMSTIDTVFISHSHRDHTGGAGWEAQGTFSLGTTQTNLAGKTVYAPSSLSYPELNVNEIRLPTVISDGIASTGAISRALFVGGIQEQALVINVANKGLVVIVGCGHQTMDRLLQRIDETFEVPLYAIIGDLHYPVPQGRLFIAGVDVQRRLASGKSILNPLDYEDIKREILTLEARNLGLLALGGHDTSDETLGAFSLTFGKRFQYVEVGKPITVLSSDL